MHRDPPVIPVVAAILRDGQGRLLIARRPAHKRHGGLWEFPGGKVHDGESLAQAIARELQEELGLQAGWVAPEPVFRKRDPGQPFQILFVEAEARGTPRLFEHSRIAWVPTPVPPGFSLAPSDAAFAASVADGSVLLGAGPPSELT